MYLVVDHAGNQVLAIGIQHLDTFIGRDAPGDFLDALAFDENIGIANLAFVYETSIGNE
jgi:hypothetical protein